MPLADEQTAIFLVLEQLAARGLKTREVGGRPLKLTQAAQAAFSDVSMDDILKLKRSTAAAGQLHSGAVIRLEPPNHSPQSITILWCKWDFGVEPPVCAFNYGEYRYVSPIEGSKAPDDKNIVVFLGYRYETPHPGDNHNFYHCQPCLNMGNREAPVREAIDRSEANPTWPMPAKCALELLLCLVVSLYGFEGFRQFETLLMASHDAKRNRILGSSIQRVRALGS